MGTQKEMVTRCIGTDLTAKEIKKIEAKKFKPGKANAKISKLTKRVEYLEDLS